ncbi:MAG: hypothetical protein OQK04_06590 [Kangiellaceae bacterium]|nr:hypothetical protein [Kangiellaceae bacterium]MCW8998367.1 hypothetical protein [Kangiellaceae bacterium]
MKNFLIISILSVSLFALPKTNASTGGTGWRNITSFGCHLTDGTCYFNIDGASVGESSCLGNNVRFDAQNMPNGRVWLSLIQQAIATKKKIQLNINGCYGTSIYPTFNYGQIEIN